MQIGFSKPVYLAIGISSLINVVSISYIYRFSEILEKESYIKEKEEELSKFEHILSKDFDVSNNLMKINKDSESFKRAVKEYNLWKDNSLKDRSMISGIDTFAVNIDRGDSSSNIFLFYKGKVAMYHSYYSSQNLFGKDRAYNLGEHFAMGKVQRSGKELFFIFQENDYVRWNNAPIHQYTGKDQNVLNVGWKPSIKYMGLKRVSNLISIEDIDYEK